MQVIRKATTAGGRETYTFGALGSCFLVKNMTGAAITVNILDASVVIPANTAQMVVTRLTPTISDMTNTVEIVGQENNELGVEVQCLDY